jgi:hypothetical protein
MDCPACTYENVAGVAECEMCGTLLLPESVREKKKAKKRAASPPPPAAAVSMPDLSADALLQQLEQEEGEEPQDAAGLVCLICKRSLARGVYAVLPGCSAQGAAHPYCEGCLRKMMTQGRPRKSARPAPAGLVSCALCGADSVVLDDQIPALLRVAAAAPEPGPAWDGLVCVSCLAPCDAGHAAKAGHVIMAAAELAARVRGELKQNAQLLEAKRRTLETTLSGMRGRVAKVEEGERQRREELAAGIAELRRQLDAKERELNDAIGNVAAAKRAAAAREEQRLQRGMAAADEALRAVARTADAEGHQPLLRAHREAFNVVQAAHAVQVNAPGRGGFAEHFLPLPLGFLKHAMARCRYVDGASAAAGALLEGGPDGLSMPDLNSFMSMFSMFPDADGGGNPDMEIMDDEDDIMDESAYL